MNYFIALLVFLILINLLPAYSAQDPNNNQNITDKELQDLLKEYKELRKSKGWFTGGKEWNKELDAWDGRLHNIMGTLGQVLGNVKYTKKDIINLMGEPDAIYNKSGNKPPHVMGKEYSYGEDNEHLIYLWRGWHDYLYFVCQDGKVISSGWYFAYE
jgi:hypothetical protein